MKNYELGLPSPSEQTAIASILSDMDAEIAALESKLDKVRQIKQGMMHNLLTGEDSFGIGTEEGGRTTPLLARPGL